MKINNLKLVTLVLLAILFCCSIQIVGLAIDTPKISISLDDFVALSPNVHPVIFISGSDYEMGYQWYQQLVQIFGPSILTQCRADGGFFWAGHVFSEDELKALQTYQMYIKQYAPEMIDMFKGMADGATALGIPITYNEVLAQWVAAEGSLVFPEKPLPSGSEKEILPPKENCSGFAAWGSATSNGETVCGHSLDGQDYTVTIVALPKDGGNNFVYTPMNPPEGCNEGQPKGGAPALNDKGLVFLREADMQSSPMAEWTYGITPNVSAIHTIRFANNAKEALATILDFPIGSGWYGGFWVDPKGADSFVDFLSMKKPGVYRKSGDLGEKDFLFVTNNALAPIANQYPEATGGSTFYVKHAGWAGPGTSYFGCISRNLELWNMLNYYSGHIDEEFVKMLYRFSGDPNPGSPVLDPSLGSATEDDYAIFEKADLKRTVGGLQNTNVEVILPEEKRMYISSEYIGRQTYPPVEGVTYPIDPMYAFYQLKLEPSIPEITNASQNQASLELNRANGELMKLNYSNPAFAPLKEIFKKAVIEQKKGAYYQLYAENTEGNDSVYNWGKALRSYNACQVYARHVFESLVLPPDTPEDLFLQPWGYWVETIRNLF